MLSASLNLAGLDIGERDQSERSGTLRGMVRRSQLLRLAMKGINATIAAKIVGCSKETSRKYYSDPSFRRDALEKVEQAFEGVDNNFIEEKKSIHERLAEQAENAFEELVSLLADKSTSTGYRIRIAQDFLDRNPETQAGFVARHTQVNPDQLIMAARTAKEMDNVIPIRKEA